MKSTKADIIETVIFLLLILAGTFGTFALFANAAVKGVS